MVTPKVIIRLSLNNQGLLVEVKALAFSVTSSLLLTAPPGFRVVVVKSVNRPVVVVLSDWLDVKLVLALDAYFD
ncbi:hypothetical protein EB796_020349 [Bugula neritina]|uniref:Uncharacterized protein n=1 Tax=Bugula neritina TaxID=10212 RepID=A0A7J7J567_BUGNE|nr:hypothetical protein EB796_020349 [Bugula neritina]